MIRTISNIAFSQGIADWLRFKSKCPPYYRGTEQEQDWKRGFNYARNWNK